jgi:ATP-dependent helicase/nuclease subunit A
LVEELQDRGYKASDIAFLVRTQREGAAVVRSFLEYKNSPEAREGYSYEVISQEALLLSQAPIITFLISGFQYLNSPEPLAAAQLAHDWQRYILKENPADLHALFMAAGSGDVRAFLPQEFFAQQAFLQRLPVHELSEELIRLFRLEHSQDEFVWIQAFQDAILEFSESNTSSLSSFLEWWTETGSHRSVKISEQTNAMGVYTIHKSKGLQFKVVIIPYCDWSLQPDAQKSPTLWARTDQLPETGYTQGTFKGFAPVPIKFTSALNATHFAEYYQRELIMNAMDNFNLLYVAFTRAEDALYVFGKHEKPNQNGKLTYKSVSTLVGEWLVESQGIKETDEGLFYSVGTHPKVATQEAEPLGILTNQRYHTYPWRNRLAIKPRSFKVFEGEGEHARSRVNYGILVHDLLARVLHKDHLKPALEEVIAEGLVSEQEAEKIRQQINHLFKEHALIRSWFSGDWEVRTEAPVLPQSGEIHRLDRVMIRGKHAVLVDFKTGKEDKKNVKQVLEYARLLTEMGYAPVEGYLLYLEESKIEKVIG